MDLYSYIKSQHKHIISVDSEYRTLPGDNPEVVCFVYKDLISGEVYRCLNKEDILNLPWPHDDAVYIVFNALAETQSWLSWNIPIPYFIIDLWIENKNLVQDGVSKQKGFFGMLNVARRHGIDENLIMSDEEKDANRDKIINNTNYTEKQLVEILDYCEKDTHLTEALLEPTLLAMEHRLQPTTNEIRLGQILLRGRQKGLEAHLVFNGISVDNELMDTYNKHWPKAKRQFLEKLNKQINVYEDGKFKQINFENLISDLGLTPQWPKTPTGKLKADEKTLSRYKESYPEIKTLREIKRLNDSDKLKGYCIGKDGKSRTPWNMFSTVTGRTAPSSSQQPFGSSRWTREFMRPPKGFVYAYIDYQHQEPCIQAYYSKDKNFIKAVKSGDVYMATAKIVRAVPESATRKTHSKERKLYKLGVLASGYGQGYQSLASQLKVSFYESKEILTNIQRAYEKYFIWSKDRLSRMRKNGRLQTVFGWTRHLPKFSDINNNSIKNWPIQASGGEVTRLGMMYLIDEGYQVDAIVHDAVLVLLPRKNLKKNILRCKELLRNASYDVCGDYIELDAEIFRYNWRQERTPDKEGPGDLFDSIFEEIKKVQ